MRLDFLVGEFDKMRPLVKRQEIDSGEQCRANIFLMDLESTQLSLRCVTKNVKNIFKLLNSRILFIRMLVCIPFLRSDFFFEVLFLLHLFGFVGLYLGFVMIS